MKRRWFDSRETLGRAPHDGASPSLWGQKLAALAQLRQLFACTLCMALSVISASAHAATIFANAITNTNPSSANPFTAGQTVDPNGTATGIGRGAGLNPNAGGDRYNATAWNLASLDSGDYFTWTIAPNAGYELDLTSLVYVGQRSSTGPNSFSLRSSLDGFAASIGAPVATGTTIDLSAAAYQSLTGPVEFRLYGWGGTSAAGTYSVNDFSFSGDVSAVVEVPEPAVIALVVPVLGLAMVAFRRRLAS